MYKEVEGMLAFNFTRFGGWDIKPQHSRRKGSYRPDFLVERRIRGVIERIPVEVKRECNINDTHVKQLTDYMRKLSGPNTKILGGILVIPYGAKISGPAKERLSKNRIKVWRTRTCSELCWR